MIEFFEKISHFFSNLSAFFASIVKIVFLSGRSSLKKSVRERDLLIMGNGPSIKNQFEKIKEHRDQYDLLCVNNFPNTPYYTQLKPDYFIILSDEYWNNDQTIDQNKQTRQKIIEALIQKTDWKIDVYIPIKSKKKKAFLERIQSNKCITIKFYNTTPIEGFKGFRNWCFRQNLGMARPHNVLIPSIVISINLGYACINLFGADHSWLPEISVDENNNALISQKHFYESVMDKKAHMYKHGQSPRKLHEILHKFMLSFRAYHIIHDYAKTRGTIVYNCTENSFIDAFDRLKESEFWNQYESE